MDIAIVGGGIGGLSAAVALKKIGIQTTIYESTASFEPLGAGIGIGSNAMLALQQLGVGEDILAHGMPLHEQRFYNKHGQVMNTINFSLLKKRFGEETITIQRSDLHEALFQAVSSSSIHFQKRVNHFVQDELGVTLYFDDETSSRHDYIIAADGIHSVFRKNLFPRSVPRFAGYTCWRGIAPNRNHVAYHVSNEAWSRRGRFGWAPLHDDTVYWFACINTREMNPNYKSYTKEKLAQEFAHFSPTVERLIRDTDDAYFLHHDLYDIVPLSTFWDNRILLLGDAAHATTPNMGQGAGQAIEDSYELMQMFQTFNTWSEVCQQYDNRRVKKTKKVIQLSRQIGWVAQWDSPFATTLRDTIFPLIPKSWLFWRLTFLFK